MIPSEEERQGLTPSRFLAGLWERGVRLGLTPDRRIRVPRGALSDDTRSAILALKPEIIHLLDLSREYRALLRRCFAAATAPEGVGDCLDTLRSEYARLVDDLGPALAAAIRGTETRLWELETGRCTRCGEERPCHCDLEDDSPEPS